MTFLKTWWRKKTQQKFIWGKQTFVSFVRKNKYLDVRYGPIARNINIVVFTINNFLYLPMIVYIPSLALAESKFLFSFGISKINRVCVSVSNWMSSNLESSNSPKLLFTFYVRANKSFNFNFNSMLWFWMSSFDSPAKVFSEG